MFGIVFRLPPPVQTIDFQQPLKPVLESDVASLGSLPVIPLENGGVAAWSQLQFVEGWAQVNEGREGISKLGLVAGGADPGGADPGGPSPVISFNVTTTAAAKMLVGYLRSYENMGIASIAVGGKQLLSMDGLWSSRTSQYCSELIPLPSAGTHTVTITVLPTNATDSAEEGHRGANKFKILEIVVY